MSRRVFRFLMGALIGAASTSNAHCGEVEVLHFWTSPGEARSVEELKQLISERGHTWKDFAVVGGGGQNAMSVLRQRVLAGTPPAAASIKGPSVQEWASQGYLAKLDALAAFDHWDDAIPKEIQDFVKYRGHYVAVPVNIHRNNWLWASVDVMRKSGITRPPSTFDEFLTAAEQARGAGFIAIAHGGQAWQDFVLFEAVALGVGGTDFYRRAFMRLEPSALSGPEMLRVLEAFRQLKPYVDNRSKGRDWNDATAMVIQGQAAFQIMGDWAKGEFLAAGRVPGRDFVCAAAPGTDGTFSFVVDAFAMFQLRHWEAQKAQGYLAYALMDGKFQSRFNQRKGSIPARRTVDLAPFDQCAKDSRAAFEVSSKAKSLLPAVSIDMVLPAASHAAVRNIISEYWNAESPQPAETMRRLVAAVTPPDVTRKATSPTSASNPSTGIGQPRISVTSLR